MRGEQIVNVTFKEALIYDVGGQTIYIHDMRALIIRSSFADSRHDVTAPLMPKCRRNRPIRNNPDKLCTMWYSKSHDSCPKFPCLLLLT